MNNFLYREFIDHLVGFSPRRGLGEVRTADFLIDFFRRSNIPYKTQKFDSIIPRIDDLVIELENGKKIEAKTSSLVGGKIDHLTLIDTSGDCYPYDKPNVNYNSKTADFSLTDFFNVPSVCIRRDDVSKLEGINDFNLEVQVEKEKFISTNILVGNCTNPRAILFAHYDSILSGAVDNASGVALLISKIMSAKFLLEENLFVFTGSEELSFDWPTYWGHGYRVFEDSNLSLLKQAKLIIVVDGVGHCPPTVIADPEEVRWAFPIRSLGALPGKVIQIGGNIELLMPIWHSDNDRSDLIKDDFFNQAYDLLSSQNALSD